MCHPEEEGDPILSTYDLTTKEYISQVKHIKITIDLSTEPRILYFNNINNTHPFVMTMHSSNFKMKTDHKFNSYHMRII